MAAVEMISKGRCETRVQKDNAAEASLSRKNNALTEILKFLKIRMRLNGIIFTRISLETFEEVLAAARKDMMQLLASGHNKEYNFGSDAAECTLVIIRMISSCQIGYFPREEMEMKHAFVNRSTYDEMQL